jgi:predicted O-methyltransferase YrrM
MKHFHDRIQGWFHCADLYHQMVQQAAPSAVFVEIGAWKGKSAAFMGVEIENSGKLINFHVVDHFNGSKEHQNDPSITGKTLYGEFVENISPVRDHIILWPSASAGVAATFQPHSVDFCYIDASHEYEDVKADIEAWLPKMKPGGTLAGDDYEFYPGVAKAVDELLPGFTRNGNVWVFKCPST